MLAGCGDRTRSVFGGGYTSSNNNTIDYVTTATPGNGTDFGDLTRSSERTAALSDATYGCWAGGGSWPTTPVNVIDYVTIQTTSNASDFGDLQVATLNAAGASGSSS